MLMRNLSPLTITHRLHEALPRRAGVHTAALNYGFRGRWHIPLEVIEEEDNLALHASMPGLKPEDIEVSIEDGVLAIKGQSSEEAETENRGYLVRERRSCSFQRSLRLPDSVDTDKAESGYENGVLTVRLPKAEEKRPKRLEISVGKS